MFSAKKKKTEKEIPQWKLDMMGEERKPAAATSSAPAAATSSAGTTRAASAAGIQHAATEVPGPQCAASGTNGVDFSVRCGVAIAVDAVAFRGNHNSIAHDHSTKGFAAAFFQGGLPRDLNGLGHELFVLVGARHHLGSGMTQAWCISSSIGWSSPA